MSKNTPMSTYASVLKGYFKEDDTKINAREQRLKSVATALEIIHAKLGTHSKDIKDELAALPEYADLIQQALDTDERLRNR